MSCYPVQFVSRMVMNRSGDIFYIGGNDVLPAPLDPKREAFVLGKLGTDQKEEARSCSDRTQSPIGCLYCKEV